MNWSEMWDQIVILFVSTLAISITAIVALALIGLLIFHPKSPLQGFIAPFRDEMHAAASDFKANVKEALTESRAFVVCALILAIGMVASSTSIFVGLVLNALLSNPL